MKMSGCQLTTMRAKGISLWNSIKLLRWWHKFDDNPRKWIRDHPVWIGITFSIKSLWCVSTWPTSWSWAPVSLSRLLPIQGGREKCKEGESVKYKVTPLKGTVLGGVLRHSKERVLKNISFLFGTSTSSPWITALLYHCISEYRKLLGKSKHPLPGGDTLRGAAGMDVGIYRKDWRLKFMRLEPVTSRGF